MAPELVVARRAMACEFSVRFPGACGSVGAGCTALDEVERLDERLSVYCEDSDVCQLNQRAADGLVWVDRDLFRVLRLSLGLSAATGGAFDCTTGALVRCWGFFRGPRHVPAAPELDAALKASGYQKVQLDVERQSVRYLQPGLEINLGGVGKGYAIDRAASVLRRGRGARCALVQGGQSSFVALGAPADDPRGWGVALGDPCRPGRSLGRIFLRNRGLGTSGALHQHFSENGTVYGHVLDPRTGWPAAGVYSATAVAPTAAEADALSTAFYVLGVEGTAAFLQTRRDMGAVLVVPGRMVRLGSVEMEVTK